MNHYQEDEYQYRDFDWKILRRLLGYVKPYKLKLSLSVILLLGVALFELAGPIITKHAIDVNIAGKDYEGLIRTVLLFFGLLAIALIIHYNQIYNTSKVGQLAVYDLRIEVFRRLQALPVSYYDRHPVGRLMTRVTSDVNVLDEMLSSGVVAIIGDFFTVIGIVIVMLALNWKMALVSFIVVPAVYYSSFIFRKYSRNSFREIRLKTAKINAFLNENLNGMAVTHLFNLQDRNSTRFDGLNRSYLESQLKTIFYFALFFPVVELLSSISLALIIGYGGKLILGGTMTLGALVAFLQYTERFFRPIRDLTEKYNILQGAMASAERIFSLLDTKPEISTPDKPRRIVEAKGKIEFRNVSFSYDKNTPVLKNVSFTVDAGKTSAVVGRTGAGKTTIISLLCRFYDPDEGQILFDGVDIREFDPYQWRKLIGLVQQDLFLFAGNIEDNICIDKERSDCEKAKSFAETAKAGGFINSMPEGYKTKVGERGVNLSTGQRQLLSFARALSVDPKVLILDEATSSVDTETEMMIQDALRILLKGRTSIVIAHRLSTIREADQIIVMHKGEIREMGNHKELMSREGIYYKLYKLQAGAFNNKAGA